MRDSACDVAAAIDTLVNLAAGHIHIDRDTLFLVGTTKHRACHLATSHIHGGCSIGIAVVTAAIDVSLDVAFIGNNDIRVVHLSSGCLSGVSAAGTKDVTIRGGVERQVCCVANVSITTYIDEGIRRQRTARLSRVGTVTSGSHPSVDGTACNDEAPYSAGCGKGTRTVDDTTNLSSCHS